MNNLFRLIGEPFRQLRLRRHRHRLLAAFPPGHEPDFDAAVEASNREEYEKSFPVFYQLANEGDADAQFNLGIMYQDGHGMEHDFVEAAKWYKLAAAQGHIYAQSNLGGLYWDGAGVPRSRDLAFEYLELAAQKDDVLSQFNLAMFLYQSGRAKEAQGWYRRAAELGYPPAQANLATLHDVSDEIEKDLVQSLKWLILAKDYDWYAADSIEYCREEMTLSEIEEAERLAKEWREKHELD